MTFWTLLPALAFLVAVLGLSGLIIGALRGEFNLKDPVWGVFIVALIIRVPLMIVLNRTLPDDWLDVDWMMYESVGRALAETGNIQPLMGEGLGALAYGLLNAAVFWMVGFEPLVVRAVNTILGALACALVYLFLERLTEQIRSARVGAYAVVLWPTFVAWSTTNSKETVMALVAIAIFYCALTLSRRFRPSVAAMMAVLALSACFLRVYLVLLVLPLALTYIIILWTVRTHTLRVSIPLMTTWLIAAAILLKIAAEQTVGLYNLGADGLDALNAFRSRVADGGAQMTVEPFESVYDLL